MKIAELKDKTPDQLGTMLKDLVKERFNLRFQRTTGELEKTHRVTEVRKTIAKIKTLQNQKNTAEVKAKPAAKAKKKAGGE